MFDYRITCDNGAICVIRSKNRGTAIKLFCEAEGCSAEWFISHCTCKKISAKPKEK